MQVLVILLIIASFFYPWISYSIITIITLYLTYVYFGSTKKTKKTIDNHKSEIMSYFQQKINNGFYHYSYVRRNSLYFLYPASSKLFANILSFNVFALIVINIIYYFKFEFSSIFILLSLTSIILSAYMNQRFRKPIVDWENRNRKYVKNTELNDGIEEYPQFFYHGPWNKIFYKN